jgi:hypothetical protein
MTRQRSCGVREEKLLALQSTMTSIFFLTSNFNHSIHSSVAVFTSDRTSMKMERENRTMATKKKAKKKAKKKK